MRHHLPAALLAGAFCSPFTAAHSQQAAIRFSCDGDNRNAQLFINGKYIGDCPMDQAVPAGQVKIRALKKAGADQERIFELDTFVGANAAKRVEIELGKPQLTTAGLEAQRRREEERDRTILEEQRRLAALPAKLKAQAEAGDVRAIERYATRLQLGQQVPGDQRAALYWYTRAAEQGSAAGMAGIASIHYGARQFDAARPWVDKAVALGNGRALTMLALMTYYGLGGINAHTGAALELLQRAVATGDKRAAYYLAEAHVLYVAQETTFRAVVSQDLAKGFDLYSIAAEAEDELYLIPNAVARLGELYDEGVAGRTEKNSTIALALWQKSAELGSRDGRMRLGSAYMFGTHGLSKDEREGLRLLTLAAESNHPAAMHQIAKFYHHGGDGVPANRPQAEVWYRRALDQGYADSAMPLVQLLHGN